MPQATKELRDEWEGDDYAISYLQNRGFNLTRRYTWRAPGGRQPTETEWRAIQYLIQEWDFDGLDQSDSAPENK